jgi:hypothetical protein
VATAATPVCIGCRPIISWTANDKNFVRNTKYQTNEEVAKFKVFQMALLFCHPMTTCVSCALLPMPTVTGWKGGGVLLLHGRSAPLFSFLVENHSRGFILRSFASCVWCHFFEVTQQQQQQSDCCCCCCTGGAVSRSFFWDLNSFVVELFPGYTDSIFSHHATWWGVFSDVLW